MTTTAERFVITTVKEIGKWDWTAAEKCSVCGLSIQRGQKRVFCPHCGNPAHFAHLAEWVKVKGTCPICRKRIRLKRLKPVIK